MRNFFAIENRWRMAVVGLGRVASPTRIPAQGFQEEGSEI